VLEKICLSCICVVNFLYSAMYPCFCTFTLLVPFNSKTPLVELSRLTKRHGIEGRILAKLEYLNPGFSKKDRIAKQIIHEALDSGELKSGQTVVELTSGNTGTGLAIVCGVLGHPFVAVMSAGNSMERAKMMSALGAEVVIVNQAPGSTPGQVTGEDLALVEEITKELVIERDAFRADQFRRMGNARAHFLNTAPEIWEASGGTVTSFVDFVGTGGSFGGCASFFRQYGVQCYVVEPVGAAVLSGEEVKRPSHRVQGGGYVMTDLPMLTSTTGDDCSSLIDGYLQITDEQAINVARDLAKDEGIFAGFSAGANASAALELLKTVDPGGTIAILICDSGLKYLSTDLWEDIS
jgi:cysteine synthase A